MLSSYINPGGNVPKDFESESYSPDEKNYLPVILPELLCQSCLVPAMSSYLRNDSGMCSLMIMSLDWLITIKFSDHNLQKTVPDIMLE